MTNVNAFKDNDSRTDPDLIADQNRSAHQTLTTTGSFTGMGMIMICDVAEGSD
jgi:hypothetical protein